MGKKESQQTKKDPMLQTVSRMGVSILYGLLFFILIANVIASQDMPQLFFHYAAHPQETIVSVLKKAQSAQGFMRFAPEIEEIISSKSDEIYAERKSRLDSISELEAVLSKSPENPEVLFALSMLYKAEGKNETSDDFLQRARRYDPSIGL